MVRHILAASDFNREDLSRIFHTAFGMEDKIAKDKYHQLLANRKGVGLLFFEESYRTHGGFQNAVISTGGRILFDVEREGVFSSFEGAASEKGESLVSVVENFCYSTVGVIVIRHPQAGSALIAAQVAEKYGISVINAGDGEREHPIQALVDGYTMWKVQKQILDGTKLVVCNDLEKSRTIHSLCLLLANNYKIPEIGICAPQEVDLPKDLRTAIESKNIQIIRFSNLKDAADWTQNGFIYMTRPQTKRYPKKADLAKFKGFQIDQEIMEYIGGLGGYVLHPQPIDRIRFNEITPEAQEHENCIIMAQSHNRSQIIMAILRMLLISD